MVIVWAKLDTGPYPSRIVGNTKKSIRFACAEAVLVGYERNGSISVKAEES